MLKVESFLKNVFEINEELTIGFETPDGGMLCFTTGDTIIYLNYIKRGEIFNLEKLSKLAKIAEEISDNNDGKFVQICIMVDKEVPIMVPEMEIPSHAPFSIKLACQR